jgi:hypothetical protein
MFHEELSTKLESASIIVDDGMPTIGPGLTVVVDTLFYGQQIGTIERIGLSPYFPECNEGVQRVYVVGQGWTDYILLEELLLESDTHYCEDCQRYVVNTLACPECGLCLGCCDCKTEDADEAENDDYQAPHFLWMGRWFPE